MGTRALSHVLSSYATFTKLSVLSEPVFHYYKSDSNRFHPVGLLDKRVNEKLLHKTAKNYLDVNPVIIINRECKI